MVVPQVNTKEVITLLIVFGGLAALIRFTGLRAWHALVVFLGGFYLAGTVAGAQVTYLVSELLSGFHH